MELDPSETPDTYKSVEVVDVVDSNPSSGEHYKVHKCVTEQGTIYYHSIHEPAMSDISSYKDIETLASWMVSLSTTERDIRLRAKIHATKQYLGGKVGGEYTEDKVLQEEYTNEAD